MNEIALFLADRSTNGRAYATVLRLSVAVVVCTQCIVAKWRVLEQKLLLTVVYENSIGIPKDGFNGILSRQVAATSCSWYQNQ